MEHNPFAPEFQDLPATLPVFPLAGVLLLPTGQLPLNVFEPRYIQMVEDALRGHRLIGIIQPQETEAEKPPLQAIGCAGKIIEWAETPDGRYQIKLAGAYRFRVTEELNTPLAYRSVKPDWSAFEHDRMVYKSLSLDRGKLKELLRAYFVKEEMSCDWQKVEDVPDGKLITCLSMVCPFNGPEKQALLEAPCGKARAAMFMALLELAVHERPFKACH